MKVAPLSCKHPLNSGLCAFGSGFDALRRFLRARSDCFAFISKKIPQGRPRGLIDEASDSSLWFSFQTPPTNSGVGCKEVWSFPGQFDF